MSYYLHPQPELCVVPLLKVWSYSIQTLILYFNDPIHYFRLDIDWIHLTFYAPVCFLQPIILSVSAHLSSSLGHSPKQFLLSLGCLPVLSHHCSHCLSSCAMPATSAQAEPLSAPACSSSPVIILLATPTASLLPATTSGRECGCQSGICLCPTLTTNPQSKDGVGVFWQQGLQYATSIIVHGRNPSSTLWFKFL